MVQNTAVARHTLRHVCNVSSFALDVGLDTPKTLSLMFARNISYLHEVSAWA